MSAVIKSVLNNSLAQRAGLKAGDEIICINGKNVVDFLDFMFLTADEDIEIELPNRKVRIRNPEYMPLGIEFNTVLIDEPKQCMNKCVFCFIDQLPPNMRSGVYFKDDDYRLSFLQGNYITLTNANDVDLEKIINYNLPRINISVHTTNPELRKTMLRNKNAGNILSIIEKFAQNGIMMNCQIVLCRNYNDKEELHRTVRELSQFHENIQSVSVVPVGLSKFRENLANLVPFEKVSAMEVVTQIHLLRKEFKEKFGSNFVHLADEFYLMAGASFPDFEEYEDFPQIENGVGLIPSLEYEFDQALNNAGEVLDTPKTVATGELACDFIRSLAEKTGCRNIKVEKIRNNYFGESITVAGLITGGDIITQLKGKILGNSLLISKSMLKFEEDVFLDDVKVEDVEKALNVKIIAVPNDGWELHDAIIS